MSDVLGFFGDIKDYHLGISEPSLRLAKLRRASSVGPPPNSTVVILPKERKLCTVCLIYH